MEPLTSILRFLALDSASKLAYLSVRQNRPRRFFGSDELTNDPLLIFGDRSHHYLESGGVPESRELRALLEEIWSLLGAMFALKHTYPGGELLWNLNVAEDCRGELSVLWDILRRLSASALLLMGELPGAPGKSFDELWKPELEELVPLTIHPSKARVYQRLAALFSRCSARAPDPRCQQLWQLAENDAAPSILGRELPQSYQLFLKHSPLYTPCGWTFFGFAESPEYSIRQQNEELLESRLLPEGWLCFANVSDDALYFLTTSAGARRKMRVCGERGRRICRSPSRHMKLLPPASPIFFSKNAPGSPASSRKERWRSPLNARCWLIWWANCNAPKPRAIQQWLVVEKL